MCSWFVQSWKNLLIHYHDSDVLYNMDNVHIAPIEVHVRDAVFIGEKMAKISSQLLVGMEWLWTSMQPAPSWILSVCS